MNPNQLEQRIAALEKWQQDRIRQQITFPLDTWSQTILGKYFMHIIGNITIVAGAAGNQFPKYIGQEGNQQFIVDQNNLIPYTVNVTTNFFTANANLENGMDVEVSTTDSAPSPLEPGEDYFVINATGTTIGTTFQLTSSLGNVTGVSVNNGGTSYTVNDVLTLIGGNSNAAVKVLTVSAGVVTSISISSAGSDYSVATGTSALSTTGGTGSGCKINVTSVGPGSPIDITTIGSGGQFISTFGF